MTSTETAQSTDSTTGAPSAAALSVNRSTATIAWAAESLRAGTVTSVGLVGDAIAAADSLDGRLGTFISRYTDQALEAAVAIDDAFAAGEDPGPLAGIPLGIKDIITTAEGPTTGQGVAHDLAAMSGDAVVVQRLRSAGGIIVGKTSTMEFACGLPDASKPFPVPRNPWNPERWTGGSSSGTGSGVAAGMFLGGLGTDTGGSIRIPAAFCGITGLMPTFGRVPKSGCIALGYSLDHIGPMARSARDCAVMFDELAGFDASDGTAIDVPTQRTVEALDGDLTGVVIGADLVSGFGGEQQDPALEAALHAAIAVLEERGAKVVEVTVPFYLEAQRALDVICGGESTAYHLPDLRTRLDDYVASNRARFAQNLVYTAADYVQAQRARRVIHRELLAMFAGANGLDMILSPTTFAGALPLDGLVGPWFDTINTAYWDLVGTPAVSVPIGFTGDGLPLAMQLAGRPFDEATILRAADAYQQDTAWHLAVPAHPVASAAA